jgi:hypothetical protein
MAALAFAASPGQENRFFGRATERNIFMALLAILFFAAFGEEISWGQRLFGWHTPSSYAALNVQAETNLHNLWLFQATNFDGSYKSWFERILNTDRLVSVFWMIYCVLIPLLAIVSAPARALAQAVGFPIPSLLASAIFLSNYVASKLAVSLFSFDKLHERALQEYREAAYAVGFLVLAILLWRFFAERARDIRIVERGSRLGHPIRT